jgi:hypothetical protein
MLLIPGVFAHLYGGPLKRPNKPMVPTAPNELDEYPLGPLRRHIGQPLGSRE